MRTLLPKTKLLAKIKGEVIEAEVVWATDEDALLFDLNKNKDIYVLLDEIELFDIEPALDKTSLTTVSNDLFKGIVSRQELIKFYKELKDENTVLITISDPDNIPVSKEIQNAFKDSLSLQFWDVEEAIGKYNPISDAQAKEIKDFILKNKENNFIINCEAGMSRSAGIGLAVECLITYKGNSYDMAMYGSDITTMARYHPNLFVKDKILNSI